VTIAKVIEDLLAKTRRLVFLTSYNSEKRNFINMSDVVDSNATQIILDPIKRDFG